MRNRGKWADDYYYKNEFVWQDNYNVLHISAMYSREDIVKLLLSKRGVDPFATGGVSDTRYDYVSQYGTNIVLWTDSIKSSEFEDCFPEHSVLTLHKILNNSTIVSNIGFIRPSHNAEKERTLIQQEN